MAQTQTRVVGSGFTTFNFNGNPIAWLDGVQDSGQTAIGGGAGQGFDTVTPLGARYAQEVVTSRVLNPGTLTCTVRELWNAPAWHQFQGLGSSALFPNGTNDIVQVFEAMAQMGSITCHLIIMPAGSTQYRGQTYNNCTVVGIDDSETVTIGALTIPRKITILYTHKTALATSGPAVY